LSMKTVIYNIVALQFIDLFSNEKCSYKLFSIELRERGYIT